MVRRGDVYYARIETGVGSEQKKNRPVLVIQNDCGNLHSATTIVAMITSKPKRRLPTHVKLRGNKMGLAPKSTVMLEQIQTFDKSRLIRPMGHLNKRVMKKVDRALARSLGIHRKQGVDEICTT